MTVKFTTRSRIDSMRATFKTRPKLSLFGGSSGDSLSNGSTLTTSYYHDRAWTEEKTLADPYVQIRINEQESQLETVVESIDVVKNLVFCRLESGSKMTFMIAFTQLKNAEAERDHLFGIIGQLEYLRQEILDAEVHFDWKKQCKEIMEREPLKFSVKDEDDNGLSIEELKEQVRSYCQSFG